MVTWAELQGITLGGQESPKVWLDVEDEYAGEATTIIVKVGAAETLCRSAGVASGIYTRRGYWRGKVENTTAFSHLLLFDAWPPHQNPDEFWPYGDWDRATVRQYGFDANLAGVNVDLDSRWRNVLPPVP